MEDGRSNKIIWPTVLLIISLPTHFIVGNGANVFIWIKNNATIKVQNRFIILIIYTLWMTINAWFSI